MADLAGAPPTGAPAVRLEHHDSLDGIRGLAVAAVLCFHADLSWAVGGYLGVSAFFTLSGFLITTLLLTEHARTGRLGLVSFWSRRIRRLLPAAIVTVLGALAYVVAFGDGPALDQLRGDALAALAYVANWRFIASELSYAELFTKDAPLQHLWSLAIEEQVYVVLPLAAAFAVRSTNPARRLAVLAAVGLVASVGASMLVEGVDRRYYGTDTRAAEILIGVLLACAHHRVDLVRRLPNRALQVAGAAGLLTLGALWATTQQSNDALHPWILGLHALITGVVILAALGRGACTTALSVRPLVVLGIASYGVYLYHWPVYLWLDEARTGLETAPLFALRATVTALLAAISYRFLEQPIRRGRTSAPAHVYRRGIVAMAAAAAIVFVTTTVVDRPPLIDFAAATTAFDDLDTSVPPSRDVPAPHDPDSPATSTRAPRVALFGDSTALVLVPGLLQWSQSTNRILLVEGIAELGCGIGRGGERTGYDGSLQPVIEGCEFDLAWPPALAAGRPDVAVVQAGIWDIVERRLPGDDEVRSIGDPVYDEFLRAEFRAAADLLLDTVDRVAWVLQPPPIATSRPADDQVFPRLALLNDLVTELFLDDASVGIIDLGAWLASTPEGTESFALRPDGTHFGRIQSERAAEFVGPAILASIDDPRRIIGPSDLP